MEEHLLKKKIKTILGIINNLVLFRWLASLAVESVKIKNKK